MTGYLVGNRYRLGDPVGWGGMCVVYPGWDGRLGQRVAVKVLRADLARDPAFRARFRREAQNAAALNHPGIVAVYDSGETAGATGPVPYIVMEYVDGDTLRGVLHRAGPLPPGRAIRIAADVCGALDFAHRHGIVHRGVTPASIMLDRAGAVKVMDFGGATAAGTAPVPAAAIGTARYPSPEQVRGESVDARTDLYATGCLLYELLTGTAAFTGDPPTAITSRHVPQAPRPPSQARPGLPRECDAVVLTALNTNPLNRYQTAAEMRSDLLHALPGQPVRAAQPNPAPHSQGRTAVVGAPAPHNVARLPVLPTPPAPATTAPDREPDQRTRRHRGGTPAGVAAVCVALAAAIWLTLRVVTAPLPASLVAVPDLTGMSLGQATTALQADQLTVGAITPAASNQAKKDKVVDQRPSRHTDVTQGSAVALDIGTGTTP